MRMKKKDLIDLQNTFKKIFLVKHNYFRITQQVAVNAFAVIAYTTTVYSHKFACYQKDPNFTGRNICMQPSLPYIVCNLTYYIPYV